MQKRGTALCSRCSISAGIRRLKLTPGLSRTNGTSTNCSLAVWRADHALFELLMRLREIGGPEAYDAVEQIVSLLFPDGHLGLYHNTLQYNAVHKAFRLCGAQRWEDAIEALRTARRHAEAMTKLCADFGGRKFRCTAKLFDMLEVDVPVPETGVTDLDNFLRCLDNNRCFDPLRGRADFQSLASPRCGS